MSRSPATGGLLGAGACALVALVLVPKLSCPTASSLGMAAAVVAGIFSIAIRRDVTNEDVRWQHHKSETRRIIYLLYSPEKSLCDCSSQRIVFEIFYKFL